MSPASGCGGASLTVSLVNQNYPWLGDYAGSIRIDSPNAINSPQFVQAHVRIKSTSTPPSGSVDTPANGAVVSGSIAVTGWAIDDIGVARVTICRSPVAGEATPPNGSCAPGQLYVGDAVSIEDARPDIEGFSPTTPLNYRAGWGFLVLTNMLPNQGTGTFTLHMHAIDQEGQRGALGSRVIVAQNSTAQEPFGAIDTPGQGETISGTNYANFGWVLSRVRRADPPGGGSVFVYIDGVAVGSPGGWASRADLTALFPGYPGISNALGVYSFNTLAYSNGLHTIVWVVTDSAGRGGRCREPILLGLQRGQSADGVGRERHAPRGARSRPASGGRRRAHGGGVDRCSRGLRPVDADSGRVARDRRGPASVDDGAGSRRDSAR